ncbi:MAG: Crp/Fnr family transcriptional regulator [Hyphomicrobiaceae bacterium]
MTLSPQSHPLAQMVRKLNQAHKLDEQDVQAVLNLPHTVQSFSPAGYIVRDGDKPKNSCLLISGFAYRHKVVQDGGRQIVSIHMPGDMVDLHNSLLGTADHNVQALSHIEVALIPVAAIRDIAFQRPAVGLAMWYDTLVDGSIHREWTANVGRRNARTRIAHLLCEFGVRVEAAGLGTTCDYELPMTQEQLADCTGLTPVHVNRTLMALDGEGLTQRSKRAVIIKDWNKLARAGDFSSEYLHLPNGHL